MLDRRADDEDDSGRRRAHDLAGELAAPVTLSLAGGPLHRLGCRFGMVRNGTHSVRLGLLIGTGLWGVLITLAVVGGAPRPIFSLALLGAHVRLLVAIPLLFICETWLAPRLTTFVKAIVRSGIVPSTSLPEFRAAIAQTTRWTDSWLVDSLCLVVAVVVSLAASRLHLSGTTATANLARGASPAALWYWFVCLPVFRFLMIRWLPRVALWGHFIWRLTRLPLHLVPTHPDHVGGLGYLEVVHTRFMPLVFALSAVQSAAIAEELVTGATMFAAIYPALVLVLIVDVVLFVGPLVLVIPTLWACKEQGLVDYGGLAQRYVGAFEAKWLKSGDATREPLLGTADLQSLADLDNSASIVRSMRVAPVSSPLLTKLAAAALLPMLPLFLFKYPVGVLATRFFGRLIGL